MDIPSKKVGVDSVSGLDIHRQQLYFIGSMRENSVQVFYNEFLVSNGNPVLPMRKVEWCYFVRNIRAIPAIPAIPAVLDEDGNEITPEVPEVPEVPAYNGFDHWVNYATGSYTLGQVIPASIDGTLAEIPLNAPNNYIVTHAN